VALGDDDGVDDGVLVKVPVCVELWVKVAVGVGVKLWVALAVCD